jgi:AcrR family transcriptional regulator
MNDAETVMDPRSYALQAAMRLFWSKGADEASYADLVQATGLSRKALYAAWPDKNALVHETLAAYRDQILSQVLAPLAEPGGRDGLVQVLNDLQGAALAPGWRGCYLLRTGTGPRANDPQVAALFAAHLVQLGGLIAKAIRVGQREGKIALDIEPDQAAELSVALVVGLTSISGLPGSSDRVADWFRHLRRINGIAED